MHSHKLSDTPVSLVELCLIVNSVSNLRCKSCNVCYIFVIKIKTVGKEKAKLSAIH